MTYTEKEGANVLLTKKENIVNEFHELLDMFEFKHGMRCDFMSGYILIENETKHKRHLETYLKDREELMLCMEKNFNCRFETEPDLEEIINKELQDNKMK